MSFSDAFRRYNPFFIPEMYSVIIFPKNGKTKKGYDRSSVSAILK